MEKIPDVINASKGSIGLTDYGLAKAIYLHFASVANQIEFIMNRDKIKGNAGEGRSTSEIIQFEIDIAKELYLLAKADSRIGFEATNQYYYLPQDLIEKVINCHYILGQ
ncbi:MAG: hypothetical protein GX640_05010 [Fibrobacter sp.]|nr:hypothetical protein [Fibrobacter sp.]